MAKRYVPAYAPMLTDRQWSILAPLFPDPPVSPHGGQQPIANRHCFEGILWMLRFGAAWNGLPRTYPSASTCWRRLQEWADAGILERVWQALLSELDAQGRLVWEECFADATFIPAKKGGDSSAPPSGARARSWWWWRMARAYLSGSMWPRPHRTRPRSSNRPSTG